MGKPSYKALLPFLIFLVVFITLNVTYNANLVVRDNFPIYSAFIALIASIFTFRKNENLNEKAEIFIEGCSQPIVLHMCFIFFLSTVFTTVLEKIGGISAAVNLSLLIIPSIFVLPGMFVVSSLFSFTVGTSMGAIAAFMPIAVSIATELSINPSLIAATIVCGAMFGDNLSILSDTTLSAVKVTGTTIAKKLSLNIKIAMPAFFATIMMLTYQNYLLESSIPVIHESTLTLLNLLKVVPYFVTFYLAFTGIDILIVLVLGIIAAMSIGLWLQSLTFLETINLTFDGFYASKEIVNVFILVMLLSGLSRIISHNGGIDYLINKLEDKIKSARHAKLTILLLITLINITIAINTISIIISGPIAKKIGNDYDIDNATTACILDIGSCFSQGVLPYAPQLLLASSMAQVSATSLIPYLYYQLFLIISLLATMMWKRK